MKIDKHNKDVRLVKIEELEGKKLIPTDLVLYHEDKDNCKVEIYILNKDKTKMKTFEDFKNKVDNNVDFCTRSIYAAEIYYKGKEDHKEYALHHAYTDGLVRYDLVDERKYRYNDFTSFTTVEDIENFVVKCEADLRKKYEAENKIAKEYNSFIDKNVDKSLDF